MSNSPYNRLLVPFILLLSAICHSQYVVSYTGGTATGPGGSDPYGLDSTGYGGSTLNGNCSGTITATFTWVGAPEAVPDVAIVAQTCIAGSSAGASITATSAGDVNNDLSDAAVTENSSIMIGPDLYLYYQTKTAGADSQNNPIAHYSVKENPGLSFSVSCSPSADAPTPASGYSTATVRYTASATPIDIVLAGVNDPVYDHRLMVGQKLVATVTVGEQLFSESNTFQWSIQGGRPFLEWLPTIPKPNYWIYDGFNFPPLGSNPYTSSATYCYFAVPSNNITVTCTVVLGIGLTVTLHEQVGAVGPEFTFVSPSPMGSSMLANGMLALQECRLIPEYNVGIYFIGQADTPAPFDLKGMGEGTWCFSQLVLRTNRFYREIPSGKYYDSLNNFSSGKARLDGSFVYGPLFAALPILYSTNDTPSMAIYHNRDLLYASDHFRMFMMYIPPNTIDYSKWVPLQSVYWNWWGKAGMSGGVLTWLDGSQAQDPPGSKFPAHPDYDGIVSGSAGFVERQ